MEITRRPPLARRPFRTFAGLREPQTCSIFTTTDSGSVTPVAWTGQYPFGTWRGTVLRMAMTATPVAYVRRSTADSGSPGDVSRSVQEEAIRELAHREGANGEVRW